MILAFPLNTFAQFSIYPSPKDAVAAPEFELEVNGQPVFVYNTRCAAFAAFSFDGKAETLITTIFADIQFK
jgi:chloramphenicol O-acetyltransferase